VERLTRLHTLALTCGHDASSYAALTRLSSLHRLTLTQFLQLPACLPGLTWLSALNIYKPVRAPASFDRDEVTAVLLPALRQLTDLTHLALDLSCFYPSSWRQLPELAGLSSQLQSLHLLNIPDMPVRIQPYAPWCSRLCHRLSNLRQLTAPEPLVAVALLVLSGASELDLLQVQQQYGTNSWDSENFPNRCLPDAAGHPALRRLVIDSEWVDPHSIRAAADVRELNPALSIELASGPLYYDDAFLEAMGIFIFWGL
jgi:hypothetical protein